MDPYGIFATGILAWFGWSIFILAVLFEVAIIGSTLNSDDESIEWCAAGWLMATIVFGPYLLGVANFWEILTTQFTTLVWWILQYALYGVLYVVLKSAYEAWADMRRTRSELKADKEKYLGEMKAKLGNEYDEEKAAELWINQDHVQKRLTTRNVEEFRGLIFQWWILWAPDLLWMVLIRFWKEFFDLVWTAVSGLFQNVYNQIWANVRNGL